MLFGTFHCRHSPTDVKRPLIISSFMVDVNKRQRFSSYFRELRTYSPLEFI